MSRFILILDFYNDIPEIEHPYVDKYLLSQEKPKPRQKKKTTKKNGKPLNNVSKRGQVND